MAIGRNNFDGVRIALALIVVLAHISALTEVSEFRNFEVIFDSDFAVKGFFAISGFLVAKSYLSSRSVVEYAEKRFRRIYPAYAASIILCLCIGLIVTPLGMLDFVRSPQTIKCALSNMVFLGFVQPTLPSVFDGNPIQVLNGSLWTIKVEVLLYFCLPVVIFMFRRFGDVRATIFIFLISVGWVYYFVFLYGGCNGGRWLDSFQVSCLTSQWVLFLR